MRRAVLTLSGLDKGRSGGGKPVDVEAALELEALPGGEESDSEGSTRSNNSPREAG